MAISLTRQRRRVYEGILQLNRVALNNTNNITLTVDRFQNAIQTIITEYNKARTAWNELVTELGGDASAEFVVEDISPKLTLTEMNTTLGEIHSACVAILDAYEANFSAGIANRTFDYTNTGTEFTGGFTEANVSAGVVTAFNGLAATLNTACTPLVITE